MTATNPTSATVATELKEPLVALLLAVADDKFILGHRNAEWTGLGPILEEDIAFSALAQDDLAHASALYELVAHLTGQRPDAVAYGRRPEEYRCAQIVELHDEFDWAVAIVRQFFCDHFEMLRLARLAGSSFAPLAALAARMMAEEKLSIGHADSWLVRLGGSTQDARQRIQHAIDRVAPLAPQLFEPTPGQAALEQAGVYPLSATPMYESWAAALANVLGDSGLTLRLTPLPPGFTGGRSGRHSAAFPELLAELTEVYRVEPEALW